MSTTETQTQTPPQAPEGGKGGYREDQGRLARMAAFWCLVLFLLFGCHSLYRALQSFGTLATAIGGYSLPVVGVPLSGAFLSAAAVFLVGLIAVRRWERTPKMADLLIDTESELKKVAWPTLQQVTNSSLVVIISVVLLGGFMALIDILLARIIRVIVLGGA
jgi:preprotein translocase SecE subunit